MVWPETDSAVQTMPAIAMTKNMPVVPERPNLSSTTDEMMIVSIVMPDTGLRAVVAIALAATEVKKKEKTSVSSRPTRRRGACCRGFRRRSPTPSADTTPDQDRHHGHVPVGALDAAPSPLRNAFAAIENDPATISERLDDAEDAGRGDGADADEAHVAAEDLLGGHLGDRHHAGIDRLGEVPADHPDQRHEHEVRQDAAGAEDHRRAQPHDVAEAEDEGDRVEPDDDLRLVGERPS